MNKDTQIPSSTRQYPDAAKDVAHSLLAKADEGIEHAESLAHHAIDSTKEAAHRATDTAREACRTATGIASSTLAGATECVRRNPGSMILGAAMVGLAVGCVVMSARRKPSFGERYAEDPLLSVREAILAAISPVAQRVHDGYDAARDGMGKAIGRGPSYSASTCAGRICRVGNKLKFW